MIRYIISHLLFWPVFAAGLLLDLWSKAAVFDWFEDYGRDNLTIIDGFLNLRLILNNGAAFGLAEGRRTLLIAVSVTAFIAVLVLFLSGKNNSKLFTLTLALFAAGVCGNLYDRVFNNGLVRDFIDVVYWPGQHWHTFNVADAMLVIAVGLLVLATFFTDSSDQRRAPPQK